ncbi:MAG TPA: hypothetical protein VJI46_01595 [Candidatus Nanoarchaeia archaeon]|nr:hypothetical protein [Candidatus Nanoarchaeia archaeon]
MKKKMHEASATYFVSVGNPEELRKNILEASKDLLEGLARYERFKAVRQEKLEAIRTLRLDLKRTALLITKLKSHLPSVEVSAPRVSVPKKAVAKAERKAEVKKEQTKTPKTSELEKLEAELDDIEKKLGGMR